MTTVTLRKSASVLLHDLSGWVRYLERSVGETNEKVLMTLITKSTRT